MALEIKNQNPTNNKRKLPEFQDPDYPQNDSGKKPFLSNIIDDGPEVQLYSEYRKQKICNIISKEFDREISFKEEKLEEINNRLSRARKLLHQIRYGIVSEYYSKQTINLTDNEGAAIRGSTLFEKEASGLQVPLHPSLKKIIGKKPKSLEEILKACPKREAAKNAKTTIKEKTMSKKEEKRIQRIIKESGIVIDHCEQASSQKIPEKLSGESSLQPKVPRHIGPKNFEQPISKLNAARLNNQTKHLIVVGNTSKYIGDEKHSDNSTHKWLVYVQAKTGIPVEKFVNKVRFFLHSSYRPNDVVDVDSPPFQLARRGWGEFPVRIQLFFDSRLQQKPVQLVHKLVLDKTLSGLQTMGSETLVELWLRTDMIMPTNIAREQPSLTSTGSSNFNYNNVQNHSPNKKLPQISYHNEIVSPKPLIDDNIFDFLDKIETSAIFADIEKIQPTVIDSPVFDPTLFSTLKPLGNPPAISITDAVNGLSEQTLRKKEETKISESKSPKNSDSNKCNLSDEKQNRPNNECGKNVIYSKIGSSAMQNTKNFCTNSTNNNNNVTTEFLKIQKAQPLQKKLIKIIDKEGNVKMLQMLVPANAKGQEVMKLALPTQTGNTVLSNFDKGTNKSISENITDILNLKENNLSSFKNLAIKPDGFSNDVILKNNSLLSSQNESREAFHSKTSTEKTPMQFKSNVFHKEGKVYIIDPIQSKLRQQQKTQVSLLKPQISLLKHQQSPIVLKNHIASDHNYTLTENVSHANTPLPDNYRSLMRKPEFPARIMWNRPVLMKKPRREYKQEIERDFWTLTFTDVQIAIEFLLRRLPLITSQASDIDYRRCYPFSTSNITDFTKYTALKRKSLEWLRAKYISRIMGSHPSFCNKIDACNLWTTKEIVLFARSHAYTPVIFEDLHLNNDRINSTSEDGTNSGLLARLVKTEIKKEHLFHLQTITPNQKVINWIEGMWKTVEAFLDEQNDELEIDILYDNNSRLDDIIVEDGPKAKYNSPQKNMFGGKLWLSIPQNLEEESSLVKNICQDAGIRLQPEEIHPDVIHPADETVLAQTLHVFIDELLRRSLAMKIQSPEFQNSIRHEMTGNTIQNFNEITIDPNDIRNAINSKPEFDFLTNKNFGTIKSNNDLKELV